MNQSCGVHDASELAERLRDLMGALYDLPEHTNGLQKARQEQQAQRGRGGRGSTSTLGMTGARFL
jgi:hypothetical protein